MIMVVALVACSPSPADPAAARLRQALHDTCEPWLDGHARAELSKALQTLGWNEQADGALLLSGSWGRVEVSLLQPGTEAQRTCLLNFNTEIVPWDPEPASGEVDRWIAAAYPKAAKATGGFTVVEGRKVGMQAWSDGSLRIARGVQVAKQSAPTFDLFVLVSRN
jgi:hypothetical protein